MGRQGAIEHMCQFSGSVSQKRRGHWTFTEFGAVSSNQPEKVSNKFNSTHAFRLQNRETTLSSEHLETGLLGTLEKMNCHCCR